MLPESPVRLMGGSLRSSAPVSFDDRLFDLLLFCTVIKASVKPWPTKLEAFLFCFWLRALASPSDGLSLGLTLSSAKFFLSRSYEMLELSSRSEFVCTARSGTMLPTRPHAMLPPLTPEMGEQGSFSL